MRDGIIPSLPRLGITCAGSGPLVVLIHGMGGDRSTWRHQIAALSEFFTAVSVDLRGYGDSDDPPNALAFKQDFTDDIRAVIDHFGVPRAHLVGLSMGGRVARAASLLMPDRVASLTLANTSPGFTDMTAAELDAFVEARSHVGDGQQLPADFGQKQALAMTAPGAPASAIEVASTAMQRLRLGNYLEVLKASTLQDMGDKLELIACPVHIITSDLDRVYPQAVALQMLKRIPGAVLTCIEGAGHLSNLEKPQAFNEALLAFLQKMPGEKFAAGPSDLTKHRD
ncbi:MAG: alpha/beta hydrolase [Pseudomonadota bacterium]